MARDGYNSEPINEVDGTNDANNEFESSSVVSNEDGSQLERLEHIKSQIALVKTEVDKLGDPAGADFAADIAAIKTVVDSIAGYVDTEVAAIKTATDQIGTLVNTGGTAELSAILGDFANETLIGLLNAIKAKTDLIT